MDEEEFEDVVRLVKKINKEIFEEQWFNYNNLKQHSYLDLQFVLRVALNSDPELCSNKLFRNTDKERVKKYKTNKNNTVSRKDVTLLSFFKRIGVIE